MKNKSRLLDLVLDRQQSFLFQIFEKTQQNNSNLYLFKRLVESGKMGKVDLGVVGGGVDGVG